MARITYYWHFPLFSFLYSFYFPSSDVGENSIKTSYRNKNGTSMGTMLALNSRNLLFGGGTLPVNGHVEWCIPFRKGKECSVGFVIILSP